VTDANTAQKPDDLEAVPVRLPGYFENIFGPEVANLYVPRVEGIEPTVAGRVLVSIIRRRAQLRVWKRRNDHHWISAWFVWTLIFCIPATYLFQVLAQDTVLPSLIKWSTLQVLAVFSGIAFVVANWRYHDLKAAITHLESLSLPGAGQIYSVESVRICNAAKKITMSGVDASVRDPEMDGT